MKKKILVTSLLCALALTSTGAVISASALDDSKAGITPADVNWTSAFAGFAGAATSVNMGEASGNADWTMATETQLNHLVYVDAKAQTIPFVHVDTQGAYLNINRAQDRQAAVGDLLTLKAGFPWGEKEVKTDISYLYETANTPWVVFNPTTLTPSVTELTVYTESTATVTFTTDYSIAPLTCSIEDATYASVTSDGLTATVSGLAAGTTKLNVSCGSVTTSVDINVVKPAATLTSISVSGEVNATVGATTLDLSALTAKKIYDDGSEVDFTVTQDMISGDYNLNAVGDYTLTVTAEEKTATVTLHVNELPALTIVDVNYSDNLLGFAGNTTVIGLGVDTGSYWQPVDQTYIAYVDKKGVNVLSAAADCGTSLILNQRGRVAEVGDVVTLKKGFTWVGREIKEDVSYLYETAGAPWVEFKPTTLTPSVTELKVFTEGTASVTFTTDYAIAPISCSIEDTTYATVTSDGLTATVSGLAVGTTKLNVSCGGVTTEVAIVVEEPAAALESISVSGELQVTVGASALDLSTLTAKKIYDDASEISFNVTMDMISGDYNLNAVGEYTLTVTVEGKTAEITLRVVELPALTIQDINQDWAGWMICFGSANTKLSTEAIPEGGLNNFEIRNAAGEDIIGNYGWVYHENYIFGWNGPVYEVGTVLTFKKGFVFAGYELKEDVSYVFAAKGTPLVIYDASAHTATSVTVTNAAEENVTYVKSTLQLGATYAPETAAATVKYYSENPDVATVDLYSGLVTGVSEGTATITVKAGTVSTTYQVVVEPELVFQNKLQFTNVYKIWVQKDGAIALPNNFTVAPVYVQDGADKLGVSFALTTDNCTLGSVDTSSEGYQKTTATVTYDGKTYEMEVEVEVYTIVDMEIKELAIVEWFAFSTFVQFPNSTANSANFTDSSMISDAYKLTYQRADGTNVGFGVYNLGGGNIAIFPQFEKPTDENGSPIDMNIDNFNQAPFYQVGDRITLQAGLTGYYWTGDFAPTETDNAAIKVGSGMVIPESVLREDVTFVFDGSVWMIYIPYTDFEVSETVSVNVGASVALGAIRVPDTATEGSFYYTSSDTSIVTVNANGRLTGVSIGTATITVVLKDGVAGEITKTVTVTVTDSIVGLEFAEGTVLTVKKGTETLDLSKLSATLVWASGKTEAADLSNAQIIGYDKDTVGESEVTVRISVDGKNYQAQLTVNVEKKKKSGCGSSIDGVSTALLVATTMLATAAVVVLKRKEN